MPLKRFIILLCLLAAPSLMAGQQRPLVITNVTIIDATGAAPKPEMAVVITGDRITSIAKAGEVKLPANAQVVDAMGRFLIPGLWDMHAHLLHASSLRLFIANGITGIREMGGDWSQVSSKCSPMLRQRQKADRRHAASCLLASNSVFLWQVSFPR